MAGTIGRAMAFLAERGLRAERIIVADHMPELDSLSRVTPAQANAIRESTLSIDLTGRLDTITAPELLAFFEATRKEHSVDAVAINCGRLDYVSSAGLRVIMIMRKACPGGVALASPNETVLDVLNQTGFAAILTII